MRKYLSKGKKRLTGCTSTRNAGTSAWRQSLQQNGTRPLRIEFLEERALLSMTTPLTAAQQSALVSGLQGLSQWTEQLASYAQLGQQLPLVGGTLGNLANISTAVQALDNQLNTVLPGSGLTPASPDQITADLQSISTTLDGVSVSVAPQSVVGPPSTTPDGAPVLFTVDLEAQQTLAESFNLNSLVNTSQESFGGTTNVSLQANLNFIFTFGIDENPNLTPAQMFLFQAGSLTEQATTSVSNTINLPAQVGFLAGNIVGGSLSFAADVQVPLQDAGQMRLSDLQGDTAANLVPQLTDTSLTGTNPGVSASLPFQAQVGQTVIDGTLAVPAFDPFTGTPSVKVPSTLSPFLNVSAQGMSGLLSQLPGWADNLENSSAFSQQVPFTGATLGSLLNLHSAMSQTFASAEPSSSGTLGFTDANSLNSLLNAVSGVHTSVSYNTTDPNHPSLEYQIAITPTIASTTVPLSISSPVGSLSNLSSATSLTVTPAATLDFTFGADLSSIGSSFQFASTPGNTLLSALNGGQGVTFNTGVAAAGNLPYGPGQAATDAASNGQLANDLAFTLLINGTPFTLSLAASATQTNSSIGDLVNELNSALAVALNGSAFSGMLSFQASARPWRSWPRIPRSRA